MKENQIATMKQLSPVLLPILVVVTMTGALRLGNEIQKGTSSVSKSLRPENSTAVFNSTEETFRQYAVVAELLKKEDDAAALEKLRSLKHATITIDGNTFHDNSLSTFSPPSLLIGLGNNLVARIKTLKKSGNDAVARQYIEALYGIGDNILASKKPTLKGLEVAHFFHKLGTGTESQLYARQSWINVAAAPHQYRALQLVWAREIQPVLDSHPYERPGVEKDGQVASQLFIQYRDEWMRISGREA